VIFRNRLLEVIHYAPTQPQVHAEPVVIVTPWINKFYILDLNPRKSMVRYLLDQGLDVFITSWKNPDASMRDVRFDDYLLEGITAVRGGARMQRRAEGACGRLLHRRHRARHLDGLGQPPLRRGRGAGARLDAVHHPGGLPQAGRHRGLHRRGEHRSPERTDGEKGYLDGKDMAASFRLLRSNSLIWHYVVHGWLYGESPAPFDVLYWNMDTTRMPAAMHAWYLRELYLHNRLIQPDALDVAGEPIDLRRIRSRSTRWPRKTTTSRRGADLPHHAPRRRRQALRAVELGPHPRHRQSAGDAAEAPLPGRDRPSRRPRASWLARARRAAARAAGGRTGWPG
jgi:polyhydroxyalkanoate synthase